jgi:hypothetical protein
MVAARNRVAALALFGGRTNTMRTFFGMILGCSLTIAVVYVHDSMATSTVPSRGAAGSSRQIVNWDVAASEWSHVKRNVHTTWLKLTANSAEMKI